MTPTDPPSHSSGVWLKLVCAVLALLVVVLSWRVRQLSVAPSAAAAPTLLAEGDAMPALTLRTPDGRTERLEADGSPRLILFMAPGCPACEETAPLWVAILKNLPDAERARARLVMPQQAAASAEPRPDLPTPSTVLDRDASVLGRLPMIPATMVVDGSGRITRLWSGRLPDDQVERVFEALGR